jgi:hypothetical protein
MFLLVFAGFTMHQKAVMEAVTERSAIYIARSLTDPSYGNVVTTDPKNDTNDAASVFITPDSIDNKPYRYLLAKGGQEPESEGDVAELIKRNQIFLENSPDVKVYKDPGIFPKVIVTATQEYAMPKIFPGFDLPPLITIHTESVAYINQPAEFIRNADYALELLSGVITTIADKLSSVFSKITFFSNMK